MQLLILFWRLSLSNIQIQLRCWPIQDISQLVEKKVLTFILLNDLNKFRKGTKHQTLLLLIFLFKTVMVTLLFLKILCCHTLINTSLHMEHKKDLYLFMIWGLESDYITNLVYSRNNVVYLHLWVRVMIHILSTLAVLAVMSWSTMCAWTCFLIALNTQWDHLLTAFRLSFLLRTRKWNSLILNLILQWLS